MNGMSELFIVVFVASIAVAVLQSFFKHSRTSQRLVYWNCCWVATVAGFLSAYPDVRKGVAVSLSALGAMLVMAYAYTPYIKIGGKIYALTVQDSDDDDTVTEADRVRSMAPDAYSGLLTAAKMWWVLIALMLISAGNVYAFLKGEGEWWVAAIGIAFLLFLAVVTGLGDASWRYPIARGQRLQFLILAVVTAGTFTLLYLGAYAVGRRRPVRSKHSMEYRAHSRLRDQSPD